MKSYSVEQRVSFIRAYYENGACARKAYRALLSTFGKNECPSEQTIKNWVKKFVITGSVLEMKPAARSRFGRTPHNIAAIRESIIKNPNMSTKERAKLFGISKSTVLKIAAEDLGLRPVLVETVDNMIVETIRNPTSTDAKKEANDPDMMVETIYKTSNMNAEEETDDPIMHVKVETDEAEVSS